MVRRPGECPNIGSGGEPKDLDEKETLELSDDNAIGFPASWSDYCDPMRWRLGAENASAARSSCSPRRRNNFSRLVWRPNDVGSSGGCDSFLLEDVAKEASMLSLKLTRCTHWTPCEIDAPAKCEPEREEILPLALLGVRCESRFASSFG